MELLLKEKTIEEPKKRGRPNNDRPPNEPTPRGKPRIIKQPKEQTQRQEAIAEN